MTLDRARLGWTENAFNEWCTAVAFGQLLTAFGQAGVPLDLYGMAARFVSQELLHVELCARVAMQLGGGAPLEFDPAHLAFELDPSLGPNERANELIVRLCCVGETLSLPLLAGSMRAASHPLTQAVLKTIVEDEALHGELGWLYLDWVESDLSRVERDRLGRVAAETLEEQAPIWERLRSTLTNGRTTEGFLLDHIHQIGWMDAETYKATAHAAVERLENRFRRHNILLNA